MKAIMKFLFYFTLFYYSISTLKSQSNQWILYHPSNSDIYPYMIEYIYIDPFKGRVCVTGSGGGIYIYGSSIFENNNWKGIENYYSDTTVKINYKIFKYIIALDDSSLIFLSPIYENGCKFINSKILPLNPTIDSTINLTDSYFCSFLMYNDSLVWLTLRGKFGAPKLLLYNIATNEIIPFTKFGFPDPGNILNSAYNIYSIDQGKNVWVSQNGGGILKFSTDSIWSEYTPQNSGLSDTRVICSVVQEKSGSYWVGTANGLNKFNDSTWVNYFTFNSDLPDNYIHDITIDSNNVKWICTNNGFAKFDDTTWTIYNTSNSGLPDNQVFCVAIDKYNNKWIGTTNGLAVFNESGVITGEPEPKQPQQFAKSTSLSVFYSPAQKKIRIFFSTCLINNTFSAELTDIQGRSIATIKLPTGENLSQYDATKLKSGVYLVRVKTKSGVEVRRVVVY